MYTERLEFYSKSVHIENAIYMDVAHITHDYVPNYLWG